MMFAITTPCKLALFLVGLLVLMCRPSEACPYLQGRSTGHQLQEGHAATSAAAAAHDAIVTAGSTKEWMEQDEHSDHHNLASSRKLQGGSSQSIFNLFEFIRRLLEDLRRLWFLGGDNNEEIDPEDSSTTQEALASARADIADLLNDDLIAKFVRLAFHDCVGRCDGCVDITNPENFGLEVPIDALEPIVSRYSSTALTRADIWVMAGLVAAEEAQESTNVSFDMEYVGRPVCGDSDGGKGGPDRTLPSAHLTTQQVLTFFNNEFSFDATEAVAIMGAHTLGRAVLENSGFNGNAGWVRDRDELDNNFYQEFFNNNGQQVDNNFELQEQDNQGRPFPDQFLWRRQGRNNRFMLNADMALIRDFTGFVDQDTGFVSCDLDQCPVASTLNTASNFANNNNAWVTAFHDAFIKMTNNGCADATGECTVV